VSINYEENTHTFLEAVVLIRQAHVLVGVQVCMYICICVLILVHMCPHTTTWL
jgi:hypothetical protein